MNGQSSYASPGLGESRIVGNVIASDKAELRIIGRNPQRGIPREGVPFSLDIEIETFRNWATVFFLPFLASWGACPDALVVVRSADNGRVWGVQRMRTSMWENCRGQARLVFDKDFRPDANHRIVFELYPDGVDVNNLQDKDRIERSMPMTLDLGVEDGQQSGIYAPPTRSWYELPTMKAGSALGEVNTMLKRVIVIAGVGAGFYFMAPLLPGFRDGLKELTAKRSAK
ncbi:hypothetical protein IQ255_25920 [Pleurocapsales cyanobacterium LEGE 10410]|nr:hypothetical protein [Pleurocapsales cyanobacterium LEGE 10410]